MPNDPYALPSGSFPISGTRTRGWNGELVEDVSGALEWRAATAGRNESKCVLLLKANLRGSDAYAERAISLERRSVERLLEGDRAVQENVVQEFSRWMEEYDFTLQPPEQPPAEDAKAPPALECMRAEPPASDRLRLSSTPATAGETGGSAGTPAPQGARDYASASQGTAITRAKGSGRFVLSLPGFWIGFAGGGLGMIGVFLLRMAAHWADLDRQATLMLYLGAAAILSLIWVVAQLWTIRRTDFGGRRDATNRDGRK